MSDLAMFIVRVGFLLVLWVFLFAIISIIRADLFSSRVLSRVAERNAPTVLSSPVPAITRATAEVSTAGPQATLATAITAVPTRLNVIDGPLLGKELALDRRELTIGRAPNSDLVIDDEFASSAHARLTNSGDGWVITDLNSTNGTFVDGTRIGTPLVVNPGMQIRVGKTVFELRA